MKHTPGPWKVTGNNKLFIEPIKQRINFTKMHESCQRCNVEKATDITEHSQIYSPRKLKEAQANALLMAAAPDLLTALKDLMPLWQREDVADEWNDEFWAAQEAIDKAEGRG